MLILRSLAVNIVFYAFFLVMALGCSPLLLGPHRWALAISKAWGAISLRLLRVGGIRVEIRGREHIPAGPLIVAAKHQSALETFGLLPQVRHPVFILKRELRWLPIFGWYLIRTRMIPVNRGARAAALKAIAEHAKAAVEHDRQIIIFPEGTRRAVDAPPSYKWGVAHLYDALQVPCVPVAVNTGLFWPRRSFLRYPGTAVIEFLPPIAPGLEKQAFLAELSARIETASDALVAEARRDGSPL